jgi:hypothetical protein
VTLISGDSTAANNAESFFDGTGYAGTNNVIPLVTTTTTATNVTTVNGLAANVITAAATAADFTTEIQSGLATAASLATLATAVDTIDNFLDTEIGDIKTATDRITAARMTVLDDLDAMITLQVFTEAALANAPAGEGGGGGGVNITSTSKTIHSTENH